MRNGLPALGAKKSLRMIITSCVRRYDVLFSHYPASSKSDRAHFSAVKEGNKKLIRFEANPQVLDLLRWEFHQRFLIVITLEVVLGCAAEKNVHVFRLINDFFCVVIHRNHFQTTKIKKKIQTRLDCSNIFLFIEIYVFERLSGGRKDQLLCKS